MPEPMTPTLSELAANVADLQRQIDIASLPILTAVQEVLTRPAVLAAVADIQAAIADLPQTAELGSPRNQANGVVSVVTNVRSLFDREVVRVSALVSVTE